MGIFPSLKIQIKLVNLTPIILVIELSYNFSSVLREISFSRDKLGGLAIVLQDHPRDLPN